MTFNTNKIPTYIIVTVALMLLGYNINILVAGLGLAAWLWFEYSQQTQTANPAPHTRQLTEPTFTYNIDGEWAEVALVVQCQRCDKGIRAHQARRCADCSQIICQVCNQSQGDVAFCGCKQATW